MSLAMLVAAFAATALLMLLLMFSRYAFTRSCHERYARDITPPPLFATCRYVTLRHDAVVDAYQYHRHADAYAERAALDAVAAAITRRRCVAMLIAMRRELMFALPSAVPDVLRHAGATYLPLIDITFCHAAIYDAMKAPLRATR